MTQNHLTAQLTRRRIILIGVVAPVAVALASAVLMVAWLPELPDPIAVHWSGGSTPDGFGPAVLFAITPIVIVVLYVLVVFFASRSVTKDGGPTANQKILAVTGVWLSVMLSAAFVGMVAGQRGLADAHDAPSVLPWLAFGAVVGIVLAVAAWFILPKAEAPEEVEDDVKPLAISDEERVSWSRSESLGNGGVIVILFALLIGITAAILAFVSSPGAPLTGVIIVAGVLVLSATNFWWRISADRRGFTARGVLGWPRKRIRLSDIRSVKVVEVNPTRDFGGWGWRWAMGGRSGIILREGKAIEVTRQDGKRFAVTVGDAPTGARVLAALIGQHAKK